MIPNQSLTLTLTSTLTTMFKKMSWSSSILCFFLIIFSVNCTKITIPLSNTYLPTSSIDHSNQGDFYYPSNSNDILSTSSKNSFVPYKSVSSSDSYYPSYTSLHSNLNGDYSNTNLNQQQQPLYYYSNSNPVNDGVLVEEKPQGILSRLGVQNSLVSMVDGVDRLFFEAFGFLSVLRYIPIILPLLIGFFPTLMTIVMALMVMPVPIFNIPAFKRRSFSEMTQISEEIAKTVLSSDECIERLSCTLGRTAKNYKVDSFIHMVLEKSPVGKSEWFSRASKASKNSGNCYKFACDPVTSLRKAFQVD